MTYVQKIPDIRQTATQQVRVKDGILYRRGVIVQVWWDEGSKETWTAPSLDQAHVNFDAMAERWSE